MKKSNIVQLDQRRHIYIYIYFIKNISILKHKKSKPLLESKFLETTHEFKNQKLRDDDDDAFFFFHFMLVVELQKKNK